MAEQLSSGDGGQEKRGREEDEERDAAGGSEVNQVCCVPQASPVPSLRSCLTATAAAIGLPSDATGPEARQQLNKLWAADFLQGKLEGRVTTVVRPTPMQELARCRESKRLCAVLEASCRKMGLRRSPKDGFVRWIFTRKMLEPPEQGDSGSGVVFDPVFPSRGDRDAGLEDELVKLRLSRANAVAILSELAKESRFSVEAISRVVNEETTLVEAKEIAAKNAHEVSFSGVTLAVRSEVWRRLEKRYLGETKSQFPADIWMLLCRYRSLTGEGYQGAVRREALEYLSNRFQVNHECFASPLNAYLETFSSAFRDTDCVFGSLGSFFSLRETLLARGQSGGSFEVNPPFVEEIMLATSLYLDMWLQDSQPLSFFIFYPGWSDTPGYGVLKQSRFLRHLQFVKKRDHTYLPGYQHLPNREGSSIAYADSFVVVLQNDAGAQKWPVDKAGFQSLLDLIKKR